MHAYLFASGATTQRSSYLPGDALAPQYDEQPCDITPEEHHRYFEPIRVTDADGGMADWLKPYAPAAMRERPPRSVTVETGISLGGMDAR